MERGLYGAVLFIDENNGCVEIDGDSDLKTFLYEETPYRLIKKAAFLIVDFDDLPH